MGDGPWVVVRPGDGGLYLSVDRRGQCYVSRLGLALLGLEPCGGVVEVAVSVEVEVVRLRRAAAGGVGHVLYGGRFTCRWLAQLVARDGERVRLVLWADGDALVGTLVAADAAPPRPGRPGRRVKGLARV